MRRMLRPARPICNRERNAAGSIDRHDRTSDLRKQQWRCLALVARAGVEDARREAPAERQLWRPVVLYGDRQLPAKWGQWPGTPGAASAHRHPTRRLTRRARARCSCNGGSLRSLRRGGLRGRTCRRSPGRARGGCCSLAFSSFTIQLRFIMRNRTDASFVSSRFRRRRWSMQERDGLSDSEGRNEGGLGLPRKELLSMTMIAPNMRSRIGPSRLASQTAADA